MSRTERAITPRGRGGKSKYAARAVGVVAAYEGAQAIWDRGSSFYRDHFQFSVTVTDDDPIYAYVHTWLLRGLPTGNARSLLLGESGAGYSGQPVALSSDSEEKTFKPLHISFNDTRERSFELDGHKIKVKIDRPDRPTGSSTYGMTDKITFTMHSKAAQQAVVDHIQGIQASRKSEKKPLLRMVDNWGSWRQRHDLPPRPMSSVVLPPLQKQRIIHDLQTFLDSEEEYRRLAIPWHRGLMLHGPPGTGKTSLVKALADHFGLDLWYISLSDLSAESSLMQLLANVSPRSLLLLEDIDTVEIATTRDGEQGKISMTSLLNALDGIATPHGLITVMTTNFIDKIEPTVLRAGRMDLIEEIKTPSWLEVAELFDMFYERPLNIGEFRNSPPAMSTIAEAFKSNLHDPVGAELALRDLDRALVVVK